MEIIVLGNSLLTPKAIYRCSHGKAGFTDDKIEGDMMTPQGDFEIYRVYYRPDKTHEPETELPVIAITPTMGWCDDPEHPEYNCPVDLPFAASHEKLWREDDLYDLVVEIGYNDNPVVPGKGSAVFIHCVGAHYPETAGCIGLSLADLHALIKDLTRTSTISIQG